MQSSIDPVTAFRESVDTSAPGADTLSEAVQAVQEMGSPSSGSVFLIAIFSWLSATPKAMSLPLWSLQINRDNSALGNCLGGVWFQNRKGIQSYSVGMQDLASVRSYLTHIILERAQVSLEALFFDAGPHWGWWVTDPLRTVWEAHQPLLKHQSLLALAPRETQHRWALPL